MNRDSLVIGSIILGGIILVIICFGIYTLFQYEKGVSDSDNLNELLRLYFEKLESWKDSVLAFMGLLIFLLIYISFQITIFNFNS
jgi:hypothetical protein